MHLHFDHIKPVLTLKQAALIYYTFRVSHFCTDYYATKHVTMLRNGRVPKTNHLPVFVCVCVFVHVFRLLHLVCAVVWTRQRRLLALHLSVRD